MKCQFCNKPAYKTDGLSQTICERRANTGSCEGLKPREAEPTQQRNSLCSCGSGKKYKKCCEIKVSYKFRLEQLEKMPKELLTDRMKDEMTGLRYLSQ